MTSVRVIPFASRYVEGAMAVARFIHARSLYWDMELSEEKLAEQFMMAGTHASPDRWFRLALLGERVVGGFHGESVRLFFNDQLVVKDIGWWVTPDLRGRGIAQALFDAFEGWGRSLGAKKSFVSYIGIDDIEEKRRLFEFQGYSVVGYNTVKEL